MVHRHLFVSSPLALLGAFFVASPALAVTSECEEDADCGAGFVCEVTYESSSGVSVGGTGGTASGSGGGGGAAAFCGDGMCQSTETSDSCSADCVEVHYCAPAPCDETSDCATGYFCQANMPPGTGGTGPAWCGDGICTTGEDVENCADDCAVSGVCAVEWNGCSSDIDCPSGFYCDTPSSGSGGVGGGTGAGGFATGGSGNAGGAEGGTVGSTGGSGNASGTGTGGAEGGSGGSTAGTGSGGKAEGGTTGAGASGFAAPRPEGGSGGLSDPLPGVCLPSGGNAGGAPGTGGVSTGGVGALSAGGSAGANTGGGVGADGGTAGTTVNGTGATGSGATGSGGTGSGGSDSSSGGTEGSVPGSGGMAGGTGGPKGDHGGGCTYSASSSASPFGFLAGLALLFARSRRRGARR